MTDSLDFTISRSKRRKTVAIKIVDGKIEVTAPARLPVSRINALVSGKRAWIQKKIEEHAQRPRFRERHYLTGETFPYLGESFRLHLSEEGPRRVMLNEDTLQLREPAHSDPVKRAELVRRKLSEWYREQALQYLEQRSYYLGCKLEVQPRSVKVRTYKARWGSCSVSGDICYNWRIVLAPRGIVDYVVVHELCHLLHHNHSPEFWASVAQLLPEYRQYRQWFTENGHLLQV